MEPTRRVGIGLAAVGVLLLCHGYYLDVLLTVDPDGTEIARPPLYVAVATVGAITTLGCAARLLRSGRPPSIRDGAILTVVVAFGMPLVSTLVDPGFHAVLVTDPLESLRGLGQTIVTTPRAMLGDSPGPTLAAVLAPTALLGIAAGHRDRAGVLSALGLAVGITLITAGTGTSLWAPLAFVLVLGEPTLLSIPGGGWLLALVAPVAGFLAVDAIRAAKTAERDEG